MDISKLRKEAGLTQEQLGKKMRVSASTISSWETGKTEPDEKEIEKLNKIFNVANVVTPEVKTNRLHLELHFIYHILIIVIPAVFFMVMQMNMYNEIIDAYGSGIKFASYMSEMKDFYLKMELIYYLLYLIFILTNYIYYKVGRKSALMVTIAIEIIFLIFNIGMLSIPSIVLFAAPVIVGLFQLYLLNKNKEA